MPTLGPTEIIVILLIVVLLFGAGRIGRIGGELGKSIREFRKGMQGDDDKASAEEAKK
ncbi:MAG: twin-arginine translocase TatA/TatE family subunit [Thermoflexales bacterium]|nr:twin-arginine translocase TatA/TatE family subunit [Thermoflexales bacterium]